MHQIPLDLNQQELINIIRSAHQALAVARKLKVSETARRTDAHQRNVNLKTQDELAAIRAAYEMQVHMVRQAQQKTLEEGVERVRQDLEAEIVIHETNLDNALIAGYNSSIPIRRIALDGFRNRYDGGVQQLLTKLRNDGRIGNREDYQRNSSVYSSETNFPEAVDMESILNQALTVGHPTFTLLPVELVLVEPDENGQNGMSVAAVRLDMDLRDPWFREFDANARPGTKYAKATFCTLYEHPATGMIQAHESREEGQTFWDHPVARWAVVNHEQAQAGFLAALSGESTLLAETDAPSE